MLKTAVIALGSNLQNPASQVRAALQAVGGHPAIRINKISSLYVTAPVGYDDQPDFINAVCAVETSLGAEELLAELNRIEAAFGRERSFRNAPRTLDLDIIDFDGRSSNDPHLTLPHPNADSSCCRWRKSCRPSVWETKARLRSLPPNWAVQVSACWMKVRNRIEREAV